MPLAPSSYVSVRPPYSASVSTLPVQDCGELLSFVQGSTGRISLQYPRRSCGAGAGKKHDTMRHR